jgi:hypothetical protein
MSDQMRTAASTPHRAGRPLLVLGILVALAGIAAYVVQLQVLRILKTPWYMPALATIGFLLIVLALVQRRTILRWGTAVLFGLLATGLWALLAVLLVAPPYTGPVTVGRPFPAFATTRADGSTFTQDDLRGDGDTILIFFRGRW